MFFRPDYSRPGKGVNKRNPNQPKISIFFEILPRKLWDIFKVNLLYILTAIPTFLVTMVVVGIASSRITESVMPLIAQNMSLPGIDMANVDFVHAVTNIDVALRAIVAFLFFVILGQGPATAGVTYILRNYAREDHAFMFSDWWENTKNNFGQALIVWIIDLAAFCILTIGVNTYMAMGGIGLVLAGVVVVIAIIYMVMHFYIYQMMVTFENNLKSLYKNAYTLAMQKLPRNLLMFAIVLLLFVGLPALAIITSWSAGVFVVLLAIEVLFFPSLASFMTNFFINAQLEEYVKNSGGEVIKETK